MSNVTFVAEWMNTEYTEYTITTACSCVLFVQ